jgi:RimJ/RimL family protein N-acetyltransferase
LKGDGVFLGFLSSEHLHLTEENIDLAPADRLVLYTDGLTDTANPQGERFAREGLHTLLKDVGEMPAKELCEAVFDGLTAFQGTAEQYDDMTLLVVEVNPSRKQGKLDWGETNFTPIDESAALEIANWRYEPPYDLYNIEGSAAAIQYALDPQNNFYAMRDGAGHVIGFCSFGEDGQVPGGDYAEAAMDIGMGIRPDLTGQGFGHEFVAAVLDFAHREFKPGAFRVTIAAFNQRAQRVWEKNGFQETQSFTKTGSDRTFIMMNKTAK